MIWLSMKKVHLWDCSNCNVPQQHVQARPSMSMKHQLLYMLGMCPKHIQQHISLSCSGCVPETTSIELCFNDTPWACLRDWNS